MCVPFRGADTPSERSEFSHPDSTIAMTCLAYYYDELQEDELRAAFSTLFRQGRSARIERYKGWLELSKESIDAGNSQFLESVDVLEKIDLCNKGQLEKLTQYFARNTRAMDFWLNTCVFPVEM